MQPPVRRRPNAQPSQSPPNHQFMFILYTVCTSIYNVTEARHRLFVVFVNALPSFIHPFPFHFIISIHLLVAPVKTSIGMTVQQYLLFLEKERF